MKIILGNSQKRLLYPLTNADNYGIMINMRKEEALKGYKVVDFRPPRKGETILMCNNQSQFSVGKVSRGNKIIWAYILEKEKNVESN